MSEDLPPEVMTLLHEVDGVLSLIVHRPGAVEENRADAREVLTKVQRYTR